MIDNSFKQKQSSGSSVVAGAVTFTVIAGMIFLGAHYDARDQQKRVAAEQASLDSYAAAAMRKGHVVETKLGQEMQIPGHAGYIYDGAAEGEEREYIYFTTRASDLGRRTEEERSHDRFYFDNCSILHISEQGNDELDLGYYGDARSSYSDDYPCFLNNNLLVISADKNKIRYVVDSDALKATDVTMSLDHFASYETGTVVELGGTLPVLMKSKIKLHSDFGHDMSADVSGDTVRIGDPTLVLRVKTSHGTYTVQVSGEDGRDRQQSMVGLATAIVTGTNVRFPTQLHVFGESDPKELFSQNKIGRLDAEDVDVVDHSS